MKEYTKDEGELHGEFVRFDRIGSYHKQAQSRTPPVSLGRGPATLRRVSSSATDGPARRAGPTRS